VKKKPSPAAHYPAGPLSSAQPGRRLQITLMLPYPLHLLCRLMKLDPEALISDFMDNLARVSWQQAEKQEVRQLMTDYFLAQGYGRDRFSADNIQKIFRELDAMESLYPVDGDDAILQKHVEWRETYQQYWFTKWNRKAIDR